MGGTFAVDVTVLVCVRCVVTLVACVVLTRLVVAGLETEPER